VRIAKRAALKRFDLLDNLSRVTYRCNIGFVSRYATIALRISRASISFPRRWNIVARVFRMCTLCAWHPC